MATDHKSHSLTAAGASERTRASALQEEEVYGMLGALLGTLEVVATDDADPLSAGQTKRVRSAVRLCHGLQHQLEALLTLSSEDLEAQLRRHALPVRPLVEHALRGAVRSLEARAVALRMPEAPDWGQQRVLIDPSRTDRMLKALAEVLAASLGQKGTLEVDVQTAANQVVLTLSGQVGEKITGKQLALEPTLASSSLLTRGAARLFSQQGGAFRCEVAQLVVSVSLPMAEAL